MGENAENLGWDVENMGGNKVGMQESGWEFKESG